MHDLSKRVGMMSRAQVASEAANIAFLTSSVLASDKEFRIGGGIGGEVWTWLCWSDVDASAEQSLEIFPSKNLRKEDASSEREVANGNDGGHLRESSSSRVDQSWRGLFLCLVMRER